MIPLKIIHTIINFKLMPEASVIFEIDPIDAKWAIDLNKKYPKLKIYIKNLSEVNIDEYFKKLNIQRINFLKISQNASSINAFKGAIESFENDKIDHIQFQIKDSEPKEILNFLWNYDYTIYQISSKGLIYIDTSSKGENIYSIPDFIAFHPRIESILLNKEAVMPDLENLLQKNSIRPKGIIHIGAHYGQEISKYLKLGASKIIFIEANPVVFEHLKKNIQHVPNVIAVNCAITDFCGFIDLYVTSNDQSTSVLKLKKHSEIYPNIKETHKVKVKASTLDKLIEELNFDYSEFNFLTIDIQGAELLALKGAEKTLDYIDAINTEINFEELYEGCALIGDIDEFLEKFDFKKKNLSTPFHPSWGDAFYIKQKKNISAVTPDNLKVIFFALSSRESYRPKIVSNQEIFCGPDCETIIEDGIYKAIKTPVGGVKIKDLIKNLPESQKPNFIIVKTDATGRLFPIELNSVNCPKLLILGDTHHLNNPIQTLIKYAKQEKFDFIISDHDRQHLHFFKEAGFKNVFWLPSFNIYEHDIPYFKDKKYQISFVGQAGKWHPYRKHIINYLKDKNIPLNHFTNVPHEESCKIYGRSLINLNISLNGDFNLRVFEVLASRGFLITDRLGMQSGLDLIFKDSEHLVCFDDENDLVDKIEYFLNHPDKAENIAYSGYKVFKENHTSEKKIRQIIEAVFEEKINDLYSMNDDARSAYVKSKSDSELFYRIALYEHIQKIHLTEKTSNILFYPKTDPRLICDVADLPRLNVYYLHDDKSNSLNSTDILNKTGVCKKIKFIDTNTPDIIYNSVIISSDEILEYSINFNSNEIIIYDFQSASKKQRDNILEIIYSIGFIPSSENPSIFSLRQDMILTNKQKNPKISLKNILIVTNLFPPQELGGYGRLMADFADILKKRGHNIHVLTSNTDYLREIDYKEKNIDRNLFLFGKWENGNLKPFEDMEQISKLIHKNNETILKTIKDFKPDVCLVGNISLLSKHIFSEILKNNIPIIHHLGGPYPGYPPDKAPTENIYHIAAASEWIKNQIIQQKYPFEDINVVYPGAFIHYFKNDEPISINEVKIAYAGLIMHYKGTHILLKALKRLHDYGLDFTCNIAGEAIDKNYFNLWKEYILQTGMANKINFKGFLNREELKSFYKEHNIFVFPSIVDEAFGITQVEAMASGVPVITSATGGAKEIIEHAKNGIIFKKEDDFSLYEAILKLINNPDTWKSLALNGKKRALKYFDIEKSVDILEERFFDLLSTKNDIKAKKTGISICMIVKNEEKNIERCIKNLKPLADELIVVDTGSSDKTKELASNLGTIVYNFEWRDDFSKARNFSISKASCKWILIMDADELIDPKDFSGLKKLTKISEATAYSFETRNYIADLSAFGLFPNKGEYPEFENGSGWVSSIKVRLFPNIKEIYFDFPVHEVIEPSLEKKGMKITQCNIPIHHYGNLQNKTKEKDKLYYNIAMSKINEVNQNISLLNELAIIADNLGKQEEALNLWEKIIELKPDFAEAYLSVSTIYNRIGDYERASKAAQTAVNLDADMKEAHLNTAISKLYSGYAVNSASILESTISRWPNYIPAQIFLTAIYFCLGRGKEGKIVYSSLKKLLAEQTLLSHFKKIAKKLFNANQVEKATILLKALLE
ncbi:MAG: FkbM family methyltransferase [Desulfobacterales bacterium]|nr:FkbM family methyltransferase [Desulfobacterales bacterium]